MTAKLANLSSFGSSPAKIFARVFVVVFLVVFALSAAITFLLPESYASDSKLLIRTAIASGPQTNASYFAQTQMESIGSQAVLVPVIDKLRLNEQWGKKYYAGKTLSTPETLELLKNRVSVSMSKDLNVMRVTVYSDDQIEAMEINRAMINSYQGYRLTDVNARVQQTSDKINAMVAAAWEQDAPMIALKRQMESLRLQYKISQEATGPQSPDEQPYWDAKRDLAGMVQASQKRWGKIKDVQAADAKSDISDLIANVAIIQEATPGYLARPNKPLNLSLGGFFGMLLASVIGGMAAFIAPKIRRWNQSRNALV